MVVLVIIRHIEVEHYKWLCLEFERMGHATTKGYAFLVSNLFSVPNF